MSRILECRGVSVHYGTVQALADFDLTLDAGETVAVLGPSGSGKSTIMYAIAGFSAVSAGSISIGGVEVSTPGASVPPELRPVALVFQNYALWPHLSSADNVAYPIRRAGTGKRRSVSEAHQLLEKVGIGELADRKPSELSGGQQQRVGLARALARRADVFLFDEPTAHLDSSVRTAVAEEIRERRAELGAAAIYATHDSEEALAISDRVVLLRDGGVVQTGTPTEIYERPVDEWAARLSGPISVVQVEVMATDEGRAQVRLDDRLIWVDSGSSDTGRARMLVRPEWVAPAGPVAGEVLSVAFRGPHTDYGVETEHGLITARVSGTPRLRAGDRVGWDIQRGWIPPLTDQPREEQPRGAE